MKFKNVKDMYDYIFKQEKDLYNPNIELYVWFYAARIAGASHDSIATHYMTPKKAEMYAKWGKEDGGQYWGAYLGAGDPIYDDENMWEELKRLCKYDGWVDADENYQQKAVE